MRTEKQVDKDAPPSEKMRNFIEITPTERNSPVLGTRWYCQACSAWTWFPNAHRTLRHPSDWVVMPSSKNGGLGENDG